METENQHGLTSASLPTAAGQASSCEICHRSSSELDHPLRKCSSCKTTRYCGKECQKRDWSAHKHTCGYISGCTEQKAETKTETEIGRQPSIQPPEGLQATDHSPLLNIISDPFTHLQAGIYLHDRAERDVYTILIDCFRLRIEDTFRLSGIIVPGSFYDESEDSGLGLFATCLDIALARGLLPSWWTTGRKEDCIAFGRRGMDAAREGRFVKTEWADLNVAVEEFDVCQWYGDDSMPLQLRVLGESIWGYAVACRAIVDEETLRQEVAGEDIFREDFGDELEYIGNNEDIGDDEEMELVIERTNLPMEG